MARLRVGDIEIDGSSVSIGGVPQIPAAPSAAPGTALAVTTHAGPGTAVAVVSRTGPGTALTAAPKPTALASAPPAAEGLDALATFPIGHRALIGGGALLVVAALFLLVALQAVIGAPLVFTGLGAMTLGVLKQRALARRAAASAEDEERELADHAARLRPLLLEAKPEQTVEWIVERSGLPEAVVVRTLVRMRDRDEIMEELNTETGDWYYGQPLALPAIPRALDERLAELGQGDRKQGDRKP
jgi:hypothetical protein